MSLWTNGRLKSWIGIQQFWVVSGLVAVLWFARHLSSQLLYHHAIFLNIRSVNIRLTSSTNYKFYTTWSLNESVHYGNGHRLYNLPSWRSDQHFLSCFYLFFTFHPSFNMKMSQLCLPEMPSMIRPEPGYQQSLFPYLTKIPSSSAVSHIPVYTRPVELYHQEQRRRTAGVDFRNLISLTPTPEYPTRTITQEFLVILYFCFK